MSAGEYFWTVEKIQRIKQLITINTGLLANL